MAVIEQFVSIQILKDRYSSCPEYPSPYHNIPELEQGKRNPKMNKRIENAYQIWYDDIQFYDGRKPNDEEYTKEINSIKEIIRFIDNRMDPDIFFKNGPDDTTLCKQYLQRMKDRLWNEDIEDLKCMFHAWQWLLRKRTEDYSERTSLCEGVRLLDNDSIEPTIGIDEESANLRKFMENLKPHFKRGITYCLLFTAKDICDNLLGKPYACSVQKFADKIAPILRKKPDSLNSQICNVGKNLLKDGERSYHSISTLTAKQINTVETLREIELNEWKQRYELVKSLIPSEMLT